MQTIKRRINLPDGITGVGAEIGVREGKYSKSILERSSLTKLYSIDMWQNMGDNDISQEKHDRNRERTMKILDRFGDRSEIIYSSSLEASLKIKDNELDFIYIDSNHTYDAIKKDIKLWYPKLKSGGVFSGHDYVNGKFGRNVFGVKDAVDEFIKEHTKKLFITEEKFPSWYIIK